jgi:hypothetical protein
MHTPSLYSLERHRKATERVAELERLKRERQNKSLVLDNFIRNRLEGCIFDAFL